MSESLSIVPPEPADSWSTACWWLTVWQETPHRSLLTPRRGVTSGNSVCQNEESERRNYEKLTDSRIDEISRGSMTIDLLMGLLSTEVLKRCDTSADEVSSCYPLTQLSTLSDTWDSAPRALCGREVIFAI